MNFMKICQFSEEQSREYFEKLIWGDNDEIDCRYCGSFEVTRIRPNRDKSVRDGLIQCRSCRKQFTVTVGTVMEGTRLPLKKWLMALHLMCSSKKGISALQLSRELNITYKTAWHLSHRIREGMIEGGFNPDNKLSGIIESDETYIGGKARKLKRMRVSTKFRDNMPLPNPDDPKQLKLMTGYVKEKIPVIALIQRNGEARTFLVRRVTAQTITNILKSNVKKSATLMTDELSSYKTIGKLFKGGHYTVNHSKGEYSKGKVTTNTVESFFALLKRGIHGTFHHIGRNHVHRYCNEFSFRWTHNKISDAERTVLAIRGMVGKRLMYKDTINAMGGY